MLFPLVSPEEWSELHRIGIENTICLGCKMKLQINVPIALKNYRGFKTESHGCPKKYEQYVLVPCSNKEQLNLEAAQAQ
jgi:hypothetical protein